MVRGRPINLRRPRFYHTTPPSGAAAAAPYDAVTNILWGVSRRLLLTAYEGSCMRVRRSSDSAEQDIGFSDGDIDQASLESFCGSGDGFVVTWYDQVGSVDITQSTASQQPKIVSSGSMLDAPAFASASSQTLKNVTTAVASSLPITIMGWWYGDNDNSEIWNISDNLGGARYILNEIRITNGWTRLYSRIGASEPILEGSITANDGAWHHSGMVYADGDRRIHLDGANDGSDTEALSSTDISGYEELVLAAFRGTSSFLNGGISEVVITSDAKSNDDMTAVYDLGNPAA